MSYKEKIIDLYKAFIVNEEHVLKIYPDNSYCINNYGWCDTSSYRSRYGVEYFSEDKDHFDNDYRITKEEFNVFSNDFEKQNNSIKNTAKEIKLVLKESPDIILYERINPKIVNKEEIKLTYKKPLFKLFGKVTAYKVKFKEDVERYIKYGSIKIDLTKEEFDDLFDFYNKHLNLRPNQMDGKQLEKMSKEYHVTFHKRKF